MLPEEMFNTLRKLLKSTVVEFLSVLGIPSNEKTQLLECVENGDKDAFVSVMEHAQCDLTALARLCSCCMDDTSSGAEMKGDDLTYYLDYMVGHLHEKNGVDDGRMLEAIKRWQPSAEVLDDDDSDEALNQYLSGKILISDIQLLLRAWIQVPLPVQLPMTRLQQQISSQ